MSDLSLVEALYSTRAMRRLRPDPVPEEDLRFLVDAAIQAPSGENAQSWAFVVVTDPEKKRRIGEIYRELGESHIRRGALESGALDPEAERVYRHALGLARRLADVPAVVLACMTTPVPRDPVAAATWYGSIFPAVQNLLLAARSRGLGATLTTLSKAREAEVKEVLGIPAGVETVALIPVGYPEGRFGRPRRRPAAEVTHWNAWGARPAGTKDPTEGS